MAEKTIVIDGKEVAFKATAALPRVYRMLFNRDIYKDMYRLEQDYSDNFRQLASAWLSKLDGDLVSQKFDNKYGIVNRILNKYKTDELFDVGDDDLIRPTRKMKDLMPYFLRKDRIIEIQNWIKEEESNAANQ